METAAVTKFATGAEAAVGVPVATGATAAMPDDSKLMIGRDDC